MNARVRSTLHGARAAQTQRLPTAGKIRPGIKVLTAKARAIAGAQQTYDEGVAAGASFDDIEKALKKLQGCPSYPLSPRNAPYFRVVPDDFTTPGAAEAILERYASKEDGQLYTFPIIFPSDDLDLVFRESFESWKASELAFWSETDPATGELLCKKRQDVKADKSRRRRWGGRPVETVGPCDPNACDIFGAGHCMHHGSLYFYVPGCPGVGLIELQFTSVYASLGIAEVLELVHHGLGHIKGTHNGEPIFWISKKRQEVSRIDWERGKAERTDQYIISIEARGIDMASVFAQQEMGSALQLAGPAASDAPALTGPSSAASSDHPETAAEQASAEEPAASSDHAQPAAGRAPGVAELRQQAGDLTAELQLNLHAFAAKQAADFGADWSKKADALRSVIGRLENAKATGDFSELTAPQETSAAAAGTDDGAPF